MSKLKTSLLSRTPSLLKIAASVVGSEIKDRVMSSDAAQRIQNKVQLAKSITEELSGLKGAAMKLGQMLSLDATDYLPPEAAEMLNKLHKSAEPVDFVVIETQLKKELQEKFETITVVTSPLAVASIGQVHRATYLGQNIVLKVQYPDIQKTIDTDLKLAKFLFEKSSVLMLKKINLDPLIKELKDTLIAETDYAQEGKNLVRAKAAFLHDPRFLVPQFIPDISTSRVLAMEFMEGVTVSEWLKTNPSSEAKEKIGRSLYELFVLEFFKLGFVQTDPNPGNFLIDANERLVLLDFGAAKEYNQEFRDTYLKLLRAVHAQDQKLVIEIATEFKLIDPRESQEVQTIFYQMMEYMVKPFTEDKKFSFADQVFYENSKKMAMELTFKCRYSPPPEKLIFLHRKLGGVFSLLKKMEVELNLYSYWEEIFA